MTGLEVVAQVAHVQVEVVAAPAQVRLEVNADTGPHGTVSSYLAVLAEDANVYSAVVSMPDGLHVADPTNPAHGGRLNGVLAQSGRAGERVRVILQGPLFGWSGAWGRLWCGLNGQPTLTQPVAVWRQVIGFSPEAGLFVVQPKPAVFS